MLDRYRRERDPRDRDTLFLRYLPLAQSLVRRYGYGAEHDDLEQVAAIALLKALDRFDPARETAFSTFAVPTILGELKRYFRDQGWTVRVPRALQELAVRVGPASDALAGELGRMPTMEELAERCDTTVERVLEARAVGSAHHPASLDAPAASDRDPLETQLGACDSGFEHAEQAADLERMLRELPAIEQRVLRLRFEDDLIQRDIAARIGVSQMQVSRTIAHALERLRVGRPP